MISHNKRIRWYYIILLIITLNIGICLLIRIFNNHTTHPEPTHQLTLPIKPAVTLSTIKALLPKTITHTIQPGDNITNLLKNSGVSAQQIYLLLSNQNTHSQLSHLHIGQKLILNLKNNKLVHLQLALKDNQVFSITLQDKKFIAKLHHIPLVLTTKYQTAVIQTSLAQAAQKQQIPNTVVHQIENIFKGTVNFSHDIRPHNWIEILYNEYYKKGHPYKPGKVLFAQIHLNHKTDSAVYFSFSHHKQGYYNLSGRSLEPLYLKTPLHYKRISSLFSYHRLDPITHKIQPHYGVDYAAPRGTPIHSVGDGIIVFKGRDRGYGNAIKIRYGKKYLALYAHMSRFAHVHTHEHISKGQTIGYVGMTGWATGPHLHFGWYVNGIPKDPLKRKVIYNPPIPKNLKLAFIKERDALYNKIQLYRKHTSTATS